VTALHKSANLAEVVSPDRTVVLRLERPADPPVILAGAAHAVWNLVDGAVTLRELEEGFAEVASPEEVRAVADELVAAGLLVETDAAPA